MTSFDDVFRVAITATKLCFLCASMRWHPMAEEVFFLCLVVLLAAVAWLELELAG